MDMLSGEQISQAGLRDWRKLGQGLHARFTVADFASGASVSGTHPKCGWAGTSSM
jgi:hypothetical protein